MKENRKLKITGVILEKSQLEKYLEKIASSHNTTTKSQKDTYPIPQMLENFKTIQEVYNVLNEHLKLGINVHPAGEWLLDNFYIIEETVKTIQKELTLKKYQNFIGLATGPYKGFARIYVLAAQIVAYSENKIEKTNLEDYLISYQNKKTLSMDEIWNIGLFLQIAIIENIADISLKIYSSQIQKQKAENIAQRIIENKEKTNIKIRSNNIKLQEDMRYPFIEYMSYMLKRYGKKANAYLNILEEVVEKLGTTVSEVIKREHFEIAIQKVLIGNSITSIKEIQRINFLEIFEKINGVEEILKQDPSEVYSKMDHKTKEYYRIKIKEISKKTKISEMYIARKMLELANQNNQTNGEKKKSHIGYYLIDEGINDLYNKLDFITKKECSPKSKVKKYISITTILSILLSVFLSYVLNTKIQNIPLVIVSFILFLIPSSEVIIQIIQYILSKVVKPKLIPKIDFADGIDEQHSCIVVIPTILKNKEKVQEMFQNLERYYLANKSENLYFTLLGDCSESSVKDEKFDDEVIIEGKKQVERLNNKYQNDKFPIFNFIYRERIWNEKEGSYLGWERKRGLLNQFNQYILCQKNPFKINTIQENLQDKEKLKQIKYVITLDADTDLILNSAFELIGAMAHILNEPVIDEQKNVVVQGYGIMQPRVGINLDISYKTLFTKIFAGSGGIDSYTNAISDIYQDNFKEGIFTGKGIYDIRVFAKVMENAIPENTVLSHDLLEGCYLRCGLVSDVMLMDGYPTKYTSFMNRLSRWIRGDWQILKWLNFKSPLNLLSKYKILDNLRRSLFEITILIVLVYISIINKIYNIKCTGLSILFIGILILPYILELLNYLIGKKEGEEKQKVFTPKISGLKGILLRGIITLGCLPYKAYESLKAISKTLYRLTISHKNLLEWTTSEEAEKQAKSDWLSYNKNMISNVLVGLIAIVSNNLLALILGILWIITPTIMWYISIEKKEEIPVELLDKKEKDYVLEIGRKTWDFFEKYLNKENNYLITDNYQEDRKNKIVKRTSSTNIGLSMLAVISANDLGYIEYEKAIDILKNIIYTVESLQKWNGHLYNWYNTETKEPLIPRYISTVDSGNFVGYLYVVKTSLEQMSEYGSRNTEYRKRKAEF